MPDQIDKIRDSEKERRAQIAWQTVNEVSERKRTSRAKLKATSQEEKLQKLKEHFKNLNENPFKITDEPIQKLSMAN